jgi:hypothetical protein
VTNAKGAPKAKKARASEAKGDRGADKSESGKRITRKIQPLPVHAPWEETPGGPELFDALKDVSVRYDRAARAPDADDLLLACARILSALTLAMALGADKALTGAPETRQSLVTWARNFLRDPHLWAPERAAEALQWLEDMFGMVEPDYDSQLEDCEAAERLLSQVKKLRSSAEDFEGNETLSPNEQRAAALVLCVDECFPRLLTFDARAQGTGDQWLALVKHVASKVSWEKEPEAVMRAALRACGMSETKVRGLLNFLNEQRKRAAKREPKVKRVHTNDHPCAVPGPAPQQSGRDVGCTPQAPPDFPPMMKEP